MVRDHDPSDAGVPRAKDHARELALLFVVALVLRLAAFLAHGCAEHARDAEAWSWGYESGCVAAAIAERGEYAGQWARDEAPWNGAAPATGWLAPAYPCLIAACLGIGGGVTPLAAGILLVIQCVLSAATCLFLWGLGGVLGGARLARVAGWALAFLPYSIWNAAHTVWDTTCIAAALTLFVELALRFGRRATTPGAAGLGVACGVLLLVNPAPASVLPAALWVIARAGRLGERLRRAAAFALATFVVCLPWCWRNQVVVGSFAVRTNLGVELMVGNNDLANGYFQSALHPSYNSAEFEDYVARGEVAYAADCSARAWAWIAEDPARFAALTLHRARLYWFGDFPWSDPRTEGARSAATDPASWIKWGMHALTGLLCLAGCALWVRRGLEHRALVVMLVLFPAPYYLTHVLERYRFPVEPLMLLPAAAFVLWLADRARARRDPAR